jgi:hypothetical protein
MDGTLTDIKCDLEKDMSGVIGRLLEHKALAVIGGGSYGQFQKQFVAHLDCPASLLSRLYLFPTCATAFYAYKDGVWENVYLEKLSDKEKGRIMHAFEVALHKADYRKPEVVYGELIEDRETQITFSALGQRAPPPLKKLWDPDHRKRKLIRAYLQDEIPEFEINIGGGTSIDVTRKGIDKAYGVRKIMEYLGFAQKDLLFVGDALFEGGNDYPARSTGVDCVSVSGPNETMRLFSEIVEACKNE